MSDHYPAWLERGVIPLLRPLAGWLLRGKRGRMQFDGLENVPKSGSVLLVANHISDLDPVIAQYGVRRGIYFMAKEELFTDRRIGLLVRMFRAFPVRAQTTDPAATRRAMRYLQSGQVVMIFPEGRISPDGQLLPLQSGFGRLAERTNATLLAMRIEGAEAFMPYGTTRLVWRPDARILVTISAPLRTEAEVFDFLRAPERDRG